LATPSRKFFLPKEKTYTDAQRRTHLCEVRQKLKELRALERSLKTFASDCKQAANLGFPNPKFAGSLGRNDDFALHMRVKAAEVVAISRCRERDL